MKPIDVLEELILEVGYDSMKRKVGGCVERLAQDKRKILEKLTSKDTLTMRIFWK